jgi:transcriptional regulator of met regulon
MTDVVSARIDEDTRRRMRRLPHINWSEVIREAIAEKIEEEERRREVDLRVLREAARITDSLRAPAPGWDSTEEIRRWRERR